MYGYGGAGAAAEVAPLSPRLRAWGSRYKTPSRVGTLESQMMSKSSPAASRCFSWGTYPPVPMQRQAGSFPEVRRRPVSNMPINSD